MTVNVRDLLSEHDARALLGLPVGYEAPSEEELVAEAERVVRRNFELGDELAHLAEQGLVPSPIWEVKGGILHARMAVLPPVYRTRYHEPDGALVLGEHAALSMVAEVLPWMVDDPVGASVALEDTLRAWLDDTAPVRSLELPAQGHTRLLTILLADIARKGAAGLDTLEWLASLGLPFEEARDDDDPTPEEIRVSMKEHLHAMWEEERGWLRKAFGQGQGD